MIVSDERIVKPKLEVIKVTDCTPIEVSDERVVVNKDEIVVSEEGGFFYNFNSIYEVIDNSVGDIINKYTETITTNITDNSSKITYTQEIVTGIKNELTNALAKINLLREVFASFKEAYAKEIKNLKTSFNEGNANILQQLEAYANGLEAYAQKVEEFRAKIDDASSSYLSSIQALTEKFENGLESTVQVINQLKSEIKNNTALINKVEKTSVSKVTETLLDKNKNPLKDALGNIIKTDITTAKAEVKEDIAVGIGGTGATISSVKSLIHSIRKTANNASSEANSALSKGYHLEKWQALVEQIIKSPNGKTTGFQFGDSSNTKSFFNIFADNINLVSRGKNIIGVKDGKPYIDGSVLRLDSDGDFYEEYSAVVPRTRFVAGDPFPYKYNYIFTLKKGGFYIITLTRMRNATDTADFEGLAQVGYAREGYVTMGLNVSVGMNFNNHDGFVKFKIFKYGL